LGCLLSQTYSRRINWFLPIALYLLQLETLANGNYNEEFAYEVAP